MHSERYDLDKRVVVCSATGGDIRQKRPPIHLH